MSTEAEKKAFREKLDTLTFGGTGMYVPHARTKRSGKIEKTTPSS